MKNIKNTFLCLILSCGFVSSPIIAGGQQMPKLLQLSPDEAEKMLEEINQWVSSQPPEFQEAFKTEVAKQQEIIGNMKSEEEFLHYVNDIERQMTGQAPEPMPEQPAPQVIPLPTPIPMVEEKEAEVSAAPVLKKQTADDARELLDTVVQLIDLSFNRAKTVQNMPFRIKSWGEKGQLKPWAGTARGNFDWSNIQTVAEDFKSRLHKIKDDRYLSHLIEDTSLYNQLEKLRDQLYDNESAFVIIKQETRAPHLTASSTRAFRAILNALNDSIFVFNLPAAIEALESKYAPRAEKLKTEEEKKKQLAFETSKKTYQAQPTVVAGVPARERYNVPSYGSYGGSTPAPYYPSYQSYPDYQSPSYQAPSLAGAGSSTPANKQGGASSTNAEQIKKENGAQKGAGNKKLEEEGIKEQEFDSAFTDIDKALDEAEDEIKDTPLLDNFAAYIRGAQPVEKKLRDKLSRVAGQIRTAIRRLKKLKQKITQKKTSRNARIRYAKQLMDNYDEHVHIKKFVAGLQSINPSSIAAVKRYAYFGGSAEAEAIAAMPTIKTEIPEPANVGAIVKDIQNYLELIQQLRG